MAQAFACLGSRVAISSHSQQLLPKEDPDVADVIRRVFTRGGIDIRLAADVRCVQTDGTAKVLHLSDATQIMCDAILVAVGRNPNIEGLQLESAAIEHGKTGIEVDDFLRTTNPRVYAAGDVCLATKFTHAADASARLAMRNALLPRPMHQRWSKMIVPWCTYTDPEIAHTGWYER